MSNPLLQIHEAEIGGRLFQVRVLAFNEGRQVYSRLQRLLNMYEDESLAGAGVFMVAGLAGAVSDDDLAFYCNVFGKCTTVAVSATSTLDLSDDTKRTAVFAGRFEDMFDWLDFCVKVNFAGVIAKLAAAKLAMEQRVAAAKAQPTT